MASTQVIKILVLGDPAQLPPVKGGGFFTEAEPDIMLSEVHRQARDNPIVHMSMVIREGGDLERGTYGDSRIISRREIDADSILAADQVLVGTNRTRRLYNGRIRELKGFTTPMPAVTPALAWKKAMDKFSSRIREVASAGAPPAAV